MSLIRDWFENAMQPGLMQDGRNLTNWCIAELIWGSSKLVYQVLKPGQTPNKWGVRLALALIIPFAGAPDQPDITSGFVVLLCQVSHRMWDSFVDSHPKVSWILDSSAKRLCDIVGHPPSLPVGRYANMDETVWHTVSMLVRRFFWVEDEETILALVRMASVVFIVTFSWWCFLNGRVPGWRRWLTLTFLSMTVYFDYLGFLPLL
jgi:hypothetical protein